MSEQLRRARPMREHLRVLRMYQLFVDAALADFNSDADSECCLFVTRAVVFEMLHGVSSRARTCPASVTCLQERFFVLSLKVLTSVASQALRHSPDVSKFLVIKISINTVFPTFRVLRLL